MPGEVKDKRLDPTSRSTWARLESAGKSPVGAKPFAAERMDARARGVDPADLLAGETPENPPRRPDMPAGRRFPAAPAFGPDQAPGASTGRIRASAEVLLEGDPGDPAAWGRMAELAAAQGWALLAIHALPDGTGFRLRVALPEGGTAALERGRKVVQGRLANFGQRGGP